MLAALESEHSGFILCVERDCFSTAMKKLSFKADRITVLIVRLD